MRYSIRIVPLMLLFLAASVSSPSPKTMVGRNIYVAPDGAADQEGSLEHPLSLATALSKESPARPGDVIWLRGGVYRGTFVSYLRGTEWGPIVVRQYPGERATIDTAPSGDIALAINGPWTTFWGFELTSSDPSRVSKQSTPWPTDMHRGGGVVVRAPYVKVINLVVHDLGSGVGLDNWSGAEWSEAYGNLIYNNGWQAPDRGHGHGMYVQNRVGMRRLRDNIIFNQFSHGIHAYGSERAYLDNIVIEGNVLFNNGILSKSGPERDILLGGSRVAHNPVLRDNATFGSAQTNLGYNAGCDEGEVSGNYLVGQPALILVNCRPAVTGNVFVGAVDAPTGSFPGLIGPENLQMSGKGKGVHVMVRPNRYELGRAHVAIYNWGRQSHVDVELSSVKGLQVGDEYELRDAQNFYGPPVLKGTYSGAAMSVPMTGLSLADPVGEVPKLPSHTAPEFAVFVLVKVKPLQLPVDTPDRQRRN